MNEVKTPKKPLIVYYAIAILVVLLINTLLVPMVSQARVKYVDYGTFIQMTEEDKISEVQVQDNQIVFITKEDEANKNAVYYRTGKMDDPELTSRLSEHGVRFDKEIVEETSPLLSFLLSFVFPIVLFIALGQLLTRQMMKRMGGGKDAMSFGMGNSNAKVYVKDSAGGMPGTVTSFAQTRIGQLTWVAEWHPGQAGRPLADARAQEYKARMGKDFLAPRMDLVPRMLADAMSKAQSTEPVKIALALEDLQMDTVVGPVRMRGKDHQLLLPQVVNTIAPVDGKLVKAGWEGTNYGFRTDAVYTPEQVELPTDCQMKRPGGR